MTLFYHVAGMGNYQDVTEEIFNTVTSSGLKEQASKIVVSFVGDKADFIKLKTPVEGAEMVYSGSISNYEYPTIKLLQQHCKKNPDDIVLYCHSKGVSEPDNIQKKYWRRAMVKFVIADWEKCVEYLKEVETVGYNWVGNHYSGNFWWAKASAINKSKDIDTFKDAPFLIYHGHSKEHQKRIQPEFFMKDLNLTHKSVGTENYNWQLIPTCIPLDDIGTEDPFDYAGIKTDGRFLLNLQTRPDKEKKVRTLLKHLNIRDVKTVYGVNGKVLELRQDRVKNPGIAACYLSWLMIFNMCHAMEYDTVVLLEDDLIFQYGFKELLKENWKNVPDDWDMVWVGGYERYNVPGKKVKGNVYIPKDMWGTHCMLFSKKGIEKIVRHLNNKSITTDIDIEITRHIEDFNQYSFYPTLAIQNQYSLSDIRGGHIK